MADLLTGNAATRAIERLIHRNPDVGDMITELCAFILDLDGVLGLSCQEPPTTYNLSFKLRDRGSGRKGDFVSLMAPSFRDTKRWKHAPESGSIYVRVYVNPDRPFPRNFRWLNDRPNRQTFDKGWVDGYISLSHENVNDAMLEIGAVASGI